MRIAFFCKRKYMGKDVIVDRYARLYEIPFQLSQLGHEVMGFCLSYYPAERIDMPDDRADGRLRWISPQTGRLRLPDASTYPWRALTILRNFKPDVIVGASDAPHVVLARWLASKLHVPYAVDLYDNFESFSLSRLPGMTRAFRKAIRKAIVVSCTGNALADYVRETCAPEGIVMALPSTINSAIFHPGDKTSARRALQLPESAHLIGTAGGLLADRGIGTLYEAFLSLAPGNPDLHLVLAGPIDPRCPPPTHPRVHYLGSIAHDQVARLFQALDVGVIYLRDTPFGRYCFPQKAYEMLACGLPLAAARIGEMPHLLATVPQSLYEPEDARSLAACIEHQIDAALLPDVMISDWRAFTSKFEQALQMGLNAA